MKFFQKSTIALALFIAITVPLAFYQVRFSPLEKLHIDGATNHSAAANRQATNSSKPTYHSYPVFLSVAFRGRLGNQMFEYAAMLGLARQQGRIPVLQAKTSLLQQAFNINKARPLNSSIRLDGWQSFTEAHYGICDRKLSRLPPLNVTLHGFLQSWKYFATEEEELRQEFTFKKHVSARADKLIKEIQQNFPNRSLVGVHVRRGDFVGQSNAGYISPEATYYFKAFDRMRAELGRATPVLFVVASNGRDWCVANLNGSDVHILENEKAELHLALLARTSNAVISSGTYSWWAGWLTKGKVIYYSGFPKPGTSLRYHLKPEDYYPPHWIGIGD
ncbi:galactoside 2-alpha-L-fucosyltransferase 3 [Aplysia californica]|uniref:L-Fucosyltransferase n=1 Tax=Aplysia californica TaxID=6500 RepID=A0ABM0JWB4_APLCA|nr:galactoside 2-alpha-L-fucosyltransferase 3 [Aplysia californica]